MKKSSFLKTILVGAALMLQPVCTNAEVFNSIYKAIPEAQSTGKLAVFFVIATSCPHCQELMSDVGQNKALMKFMEENYIITVTDLEKGGKVPSDLPFNGDTPTIFVLTPAGQVVGNPISGKIPSPTLLEYLEKIDQLKKRYVDNGEK